MQALTAAALALAILVAGPDSTAALGANPTGSTASTGPTASTPSTQSTGSTRSTAPTEAAPQAAPEEPAAPVVRSEKEAVEKDDYKLSLSLPTEDDRAAWARPGLRIELGIEGGLLAPTGPSPQLWGVGLRLRTRVRLDTQWSLAASFGYALARGSYDGFRWSALVEPTFHPIPSLGISLGVGYGGLSVTKKDLGDVPSVTGELASRTLASNEKMYTCGGSGWVGQARLEYLFVVGPLFSTGPYVVADGQWTGCTETFTRTDPETGQPAVGTQWWLHLGGGVGWWLSWR